MSGFNDLMSQGVTQVTNGIKRVKGLISENTHGDSLNMYKTNEMGYRVKDTTYRDIYERGNETPGSAKTFAMSLSIFVLSVILLIGVVLIPVIGGMASNVNYFVALFHFYLMPFGGWVRLLILSGISWGTYVAIGIFATKYWESQHVGESDELLKQYKDDSRIQQPWELPQRYNIFPDVGAHSHNVQVTAVIGHQMYNNDGLKKVEMIRRADGKGTYEGSPDDPLNKNVVLVDENDNISKVVEPMIDESFGEKLFTSSHIPKLTKDDKDGNNNYIRNTLRKRYSPDKLMYNPTDEFGKGKAKTVSEWINKDWYIPDYEVQRPAGAYIVDTEPNNTMVLAMTRAGKGKDVKSLGLIGPVY